MLKFLRYHSRHRLYFPGNGAWPQLDPLMSRSNNEVTKKRTWDIHEPRWFYRLRKRLFMTAGRHTCGRRDEHYLPQIKTAANKVHPDTWELGPDGNRSCSYCGSAHPEDMMKICRAALTDPGYGVETTDKRYKVYLRQPGVHNASQGVIKFYMAHAPAKPTSADQELFRQAVEITNERYRASRKG